VGSVAAKVAHRYRLLIISAGPWRLFSANVDPSRSIFSANVVPNIGRCSRVLGVMFLGPLQVSAPVTVDRILRPNLGWDNFGTARS